MFSQRIVYFVKYADGIPYMAPFLYIQAHISVRGETFISNVFDVVNTKYKGK
jgi:hypothetical protein